MTCRLTSSKLAGRGLPAAVLTLMMLAFAVGLRATPDGEQAKYLSPGEMAISPDGSRLYVVCERSNQLLVVNVRSADRKSSDANSGDAKSGAVVKRIDVGRAPRGAALASKGDRIYVTNSWDDTVSVIDTQTLQVVQTLPTGAEPTGVVVDREGRTLYTANRLSNDISVIDLASGQERKRLM